MRTVHEVRWPLKVQATTSSSLSVIALLRSRPTPAPAPPARPRPRPRITREPCPSQGPEPLPTHRTRMRDPPDLLAPVQNPPVPALVTGELHQLKLRPRRIRERVPPAAQADPPRRPPSRHGCPPRTGNARTRLTRLHPCRGVVAPSREPAGRLR